MIDQRDRLSPVVFGERWEIETARLFLAPLRRQHAPLLFGVLSDPALHEHTGGRPPATVEALERRFAAWEARRSPDGLEIWLNWLVSERISGDALGHVQATIAERHADLAWVIGRPWQRRGYATEAAGAVLAWLENLGIGRFRACVKPSHAASFRVAEHLGMRRSGDWIDGEEVWVLERASVASPAG